MLQIARADEPTIGLRARNLPPRLIVVIACDVAGAQMGLDGIASEWVASLPDREEALVVLERLVRCAESSRSR